MVTEVSYKNTNHNGKIEISMNCDDEREYNISVKNRKWLYPKMENILFGVECLIRADPTIAEQVNIVLDRTLDDLCKLIKISKENKELR